ncbi:hypothetical protein GCM10009716_11890 [Streptomyces sodiiphilus]|uniref:Uncharacterized protein n=1 Tax=Streptomyces sodiiphilus TaxID=226217 RepID=A0ABN2NUL6_9ACTN
MRWKTQLLIGMASRETRTSRNSPETASQGQKSSGRLVTAIQPTPARYTVTQVADQPFGPRSRYVIPPNGAFDEDKARRVEAVFLHMPFTHVEGV